MELWRILGRSSLGVQVLKYLTQKLEAAGENSPGPHSSAHEPDHSQAALEPLMVRSMAEAFLQLCVCFQANAWGDCTGVTCWGISALGL